jgi:choline monooxygenase
MITFWMAENFKNLALKEILDIEKIKAVNRPIEQANGLPNECYTSSQYLMIEREGF